MNKNLLLLITSLFFMLNHQCQAGRFSWKWFCPPAEIYDAIRQKHHHGKNNQKQEQLPQEPQAAEEETFSQMYKEDLKKESSHALAAASVALAGAAIIGSAYCIKNYVSGQPQPAVPQAQPAVAAQNNAQPQIYVVNEDQERHYSDDEDESSYRHRLHKHRNHPYKKSAR